MRVSAAHYGLLFSRISECLGWFIGVPLLLLCGSIVAQEAILSSLKRTVPQSQVYNPAYQIHDATHFSLGTGIFQVDVGSLPLSLSEFTLLVNDKTLDLKSFLDKAFSKGDVHSFAESRWSLWSAGHRINADHGVSLGMNLRLFSELNIPKSATNFLVNGNRIAEGDAAEDLFYDFSGAGLRVQVFNEYYMGYAFRAGDNVRLAFRLKIYNGIYNFNMDDLPLSITTEYDSYKSIVKAVRPFRATAFNKDLITTANILKNIGFGIDLGAYWQVAPQVALHMAANDLLGNVYWNSPVRNYLIDTKSYFFKSIELAKSGRLKTAYFSESLQQLKDAFKPTEQIRKDPNSSMQIPFSAQFGIDYIWDYDHTFSLISYGRATTSVAPAEMSHSLVYNYNLHGILNTSASIKYDISDRFSFGFGTSLNMAALQFYVASDDILSLVRPITQRNLNLSFGINFTFGSVLPVVRDVSKKQYRLHEFLMQGVPRFKPKPPDPNDLRNIESQIDID